MNGTHPLLSYANAFNLKYDDIRTLEINADVILNACKDIILLIKLGRNEALEVGSHRVRIINERITVFHMKKCKPLEAIN